MIKFRKTFYVALTVGFVASLVLWLLLILNGEFVQATQTSAASLIHRIQSPGLDMATSWFPCTAQEAGASNCEYFKIVPAMLIINGLLYAGLLFIPIYIFRFFSTTLD
ncbi:hypothetical protein Acid345_4659 [Candidatus Koribacter versatilis Ellin345]|uniref:Uncharacterized protein n=1 Tax=Koribacter versatilis (strain Ellin345) TaxID=204669 RepID=Q1IHJ1_KORVE|nr:hypothetical protein [Candidatus Koribacter versatilis]ABF43659.1 hypothetical protein Acid345_4659 [Candidatus Koribacter versatilis Ellin345]